MKGKVKDLISEYFIESWGLNSEDELEISYVDAKQFLTPQRLDLVCKLIYIDSYLNNKNIDFAVEIYTEHIRAFSEGTFIEPGNNEKNSIQKYIESFNEMICTCQNGISHEKSVVPVGEDGNILDGAHRTAIAIFFNMPIPIVRIHGIKVNYDYKHFEYYGLKRDYLDYISYNYLAWKDNVYIVCLWPVANRIDKGKFADNIICEKSQVFYKKKIIFTYEGINNLMIHAYGHQDWAGNELDGFVGVPKKAKLCYSKGMPTVFYILSDLDLESVNDIKQKIRVHYQLSNHSIHITDTKEEAVYLAKEILNKNSIHLLNYGYPFRYKEFIKKFLRFKNELIRRNCSFEDYLIDSSGVLSLYGLRDCNDIDYLTCNSVDMLEESNEFENHLKYRIDKYYADSIESIIYNPAKFLYFMGIKFASLDVTLRMKQKRNETKDVADVRLIVSVNKRRKEVIFARGTLKKLKPRVRNLAQKYVVLNLGYNTLGKIKKSLKNR